LKSHMYEYSLITKYNMHEYSIVTSSNRFVALRGISK
jgi:hypothetical protein